MYDELIAELRQHHCDAKEDDTQEVCEECAYDVIIADKSVPSGIASVCVCGLMNRAADAIEELATNYDAATDIMKHQTEYIEELSKPRWIPVTERLPDTSHSVLVAGKMKYEWEKEYTRFVDLGWNDGVSFETCNDWYEGQHEFEVTHWMPLPEPPKEEA